MSSSTKHFTPLSLSDEQIQQVGSWFSLKGLILSKISASQVSTTTKREGEEIRIDKDDTYKFSMEVMEVSSATIKLLLFKHPPATMCGPCDEGEDTVTANNGPQLIGELLLNSQEAVKELLVDSGTGSEKNSDLSFSMFWNFVLRSCFGNSHPNLLASVHDLLFMTEDEIKLHQRLATQQSQRSGCRCDSQTRNCDAELCAELLPHQTCLHCRPIYKVLFVDQQSKSIFSFPFKAVDPLGVLFGQLTEMSKEIANLKSGITAISNEQERKILGIKKLRETEDSKLMIVYDADGPDPPNQRLFGRGGAVPTTWIKSIERPFVTAEEYPSVSDHSDRFEVLTDGVYRFFDFVYRGHLGQTLVSGQYGSTLYGAPSVQFKCGHIIAENSGVHNLEPYFVLCLLKAGEIITIGPCQKRAIQEGDEYVSKTAHSVSWTSTRMTKGDKKRPRNPRFELFEIHGVVGFSVEKLNEK